MMERMKQLGVIMKGICFPLGVYHIANTYHNNNAFIDHRVSFLTHRSCRTTRYYEKYNAADTVYVHPLFPNITSYLYKSQV